MIYTGNQGGSFLLPIVFNFMLLLPYSPAEGASADICRLAAIVTFPVIGL